MILQVSADGGAQQTDLNLEALDALPQVEFTTTTIWTDDPVTFSGVPLSDILEAGDVDGTTLTMTALNDYAVEMPVAEIGDMYPIIATRMDGQTMSVRDKGPFWVVYPYDSDPDFQTETIYSRSIWQLNRLSVMD
ncbi:oxidoreductase [Rhodophyticola sp. CCM32]|uniref:oxidoreductase n=1 Tax=Rhodophyticola sp. CCM32 TaxID=2916397 RepID=UPI001EE62FF3|nr:oxidoreductase [Rhodophyticola sp. CCM32]